MWQLALAWHKGSTAAILIDMYPDLTAAALHSALAYYYDHQAEIDENTPENVLRELRANPDWLEERPGVFRLRTSFGSTKR